MRLSTIMACVSLIGLAGCVQATEIPVVADVVLPSVDPATVNPIVIDKVVMQVPRGQQIGVIKGGLLCIPHVSLTAGSGQAAITDAGYLDAIHHELAVVDYPVTNSATDLFATLAADQTRIRLAGRIVDVKSNVCFPMMGFGDLSSGTADAFVRVEWQAYDAATRSIILKTATDGFGTIKTSVPNPGALANDMAVGMATRRLIASPEFQSLSRARLSQPTANIKTVPVTQTLFHK
jgi:serine protease Do